MTGITEAFIRQGGHGATGKSAPWFKDVKPNVTGYVHHKPVVTTASSRVLLCCTSENVTGYEFTVPVVTRASDEGQSVAMREIVTGYVTGYVKRAKGTGARGRVHVRVCAGACTQARAHPLRGGVTGYYGSLQAENWVGKISSSGTGQ